MKVAVIPSTCIYLIFPVPLIILHKQEVSAKTLYKMQFNFIHGLPRISSVDKKARSMLLQHELIATLGLVQQSLVEFILDLQDSSDNLLTKVLF